MSQLIFEISRLFEGKGVVSIPRRTVRFTSTATPSKSNDGIEKRLGAESFFRRMLCKFKDMSGGNQMKTPLQWRKASHDHHS